MLNIIFVFFCTCPILYLNFSYDIRRLFGGWCIIFRKAFRSLSVYSLNQRCTLRRAPRFRRTFLWATTRDNARIANACSPAREGVLTVEQDQPPGYHPGVEGVRPVRLLLVPGIRGRTRDRHRRAQIGGPRLAAAAARRYRAIRILFSLFLLRLCNRKKSSTPVRTVAGSICVVADRIGRLTEADAARRFLSPSRIFGTKSDDALAQRKVPSNCPQNKITFSVTLVRSLPRNDAVTLTAVFDQCTRQDNVIGLLAAPRLRRWDQRNPWSHFFIEGDVADVFITPCQSDYARLRNVG